MSKTTKIVILLLAGITFLVGDVPVTIADNDVRDPNMIIVFTSDVQGYLEECG